MIYSSWDIESGGLKSVILGHFLPFYRKTPKNQNFHKIKKNCWRYHPFAHVHQIIIIWYVSWDMECGKQKFLPFWAILLPFYLTNNSKFWKNEKNAWRYYPSTNVYHKWRSYGVWFQRYGAWQTEFFVIFVIINDNQDVWFLWYGEQRT